MTKKLIIFDTTLRDGEQSPGASLNLKEKLQIAYQLSELGVDVIEAGFPITSHDDFEAVKTIAKSVKNPIICGLSRAHQKDILSCYEAIKYSKKPRIHTFIATSDIHIEKKLRKSRQEVLDIACKSVSYAKKLVDDVEFSCEDAARSDIKFLVKIIEGVISEGALTINIPDTVGYATPKEFGALIKTLRAKVKNSTKAIFSVHCHNDLGLASANSLEAVINGAEQVECTVNGLGERAGNAALEEIVMAIKTRPQIYKISTNITTKKIYQTSRLVASLTGIHPQPNKAIVGTNAFAHESGIHQDGMLKERMTYEIMKPEDIGISESSLVLGKHSGRHALKKRLESLGYSPSDGELENVYTKFKNLTDKKKVVFDDDLIAIMDENFSEISEVYAIDTINVISGTKKTPMATISLLCDGKKLKSSATGDGPVDAVFQAIDKITKIKPALEDYAIKSITSGKDALGEVTIRIKNKGITYSGKGTSTDIIEASAKSYLNAINKILTYKTLEIKESL